MNMLNGSLKNSTNSHEEERSDWIIYLQLIGCVLVTLFTAVGNLLVCFSVLIYKRLQSRTNVILFSLAFSDLLMIISMAFNTVMIQRGEWPYSRTVCTVVSSLALNLCFISILHLCLLSIDRYISIKKPFQYPQLMSPRRIGLFLIFIWIVPSLAINLPYADFDFRSSVFGCLKNVSVKHSNPASSFILVLLFVIIPFCAIFYVYIYLFRVVRQHARRITAVRMQPSLQTTTSHHDSSHRTRIIMKKEVKLIKTFALVIGAFLLCYTPFFLLGTYQSSKGPGTVSDHVLSVVTWIAFCNSFVNPVVYSLRYRLFRQSFRKIVCSPRALLGAPRTSFVTTMATAPGRNVPRPPDASCIERSQVLAPPPMHHYEDKHL